MKKTKCKGPKSQQMSSHYEHSGRQKNENGQLIRPMAEGTGTRGQKIILPESLSSTDVKFMNSLKSLSIY